MGSIPVPVTRKKIGTPQGVPIFFVVHGTTSNPAHKGYKLTILLCVILFLSSVFRFVRVRLGSHTAIGGILRRAALFVIIDIRGTPFTYSSRAADSRTCLPLGVMFLVDVPPCFFTAYISSPGNIPHTRYAPRVPLPFRWSAFFILWWPVHFDPTRANRELYLSLCLS